MSSPPYFLTDLRLSLNNGCTTNVHLYVSNFSNNYLLWKGTHYENGDIMTS